MENYKFSILNPFCSKFQYKNKFTLFQMTSILLEGHTIKLPLYVLYTVGRAVTELWLQLFRIEAHVTWPISLYCLPLWPLRHATAALHITQRRFLSLFFLWLSFNRSYFYLKIVLVIEKMIKSLFIFLYNYLFVIT